MESKKIALFGLAVASLCFLQALIPSPVSACSCGPDYSSPKRQMEKADAVFVGKVVDLAQERRTSSSGGSYTEHIQVLQVVDTWKGVTSSEVVITVDTDFQDSEGRVLTSSCDRPNVFRIGESYLVYAKAHDDGTYYVDLACGRTTALSNAEEDLKVLGPGVSPNAEVGMPDAGVDSNALIVSSVIASLILALGFLFARLAHEANS